MIAGTHCKEGRSGVGGARFLKKGLVLYLSSAVPDALQLPEHGDLNYFGGFGSKPGGPGGLRRTKRLKRPEAGLLGEWPGKFKEPFGREEKGEWEK